jgi:hypothetical protein
MDELALAQRPVCPPAWQDSEDLLFILFTSGSTGKPKGVAHSTAGYLLYAAMTCQVRIGKKDPVIIVLIGSFSASLSSPGRALTCDDVQKWPQRAFNPESSFSAHFLPFSSHLFLSRIWRILANACVICILFGFVNNKRFTTTTGVVRSSTRRRARLRGRLRLDHRPLLHRVRAPPERVHHGDV